MITRRQYAVLCEPRAVFAARWRLDDVKRLDLGQRAWLAALDVAWWFAGSWCAAASRLASRLFAPTPWRRI